MASASAGAASAAQWIPRLGDEGCLSWNRADPAISGWSFAKVLGAHWRPGHPDTLRQSRLKETPTLAEDDDVQ